MKGRLKDLTFGRNGESYITLAVDADFSEQFDELKDCELSIEIKKYRKSRSLNANAYFHLLVNKIASKLKSSDDEIKMMLVIRYGAVATDESGRPIGFMLPSAVKAETIYPYVREFDTRQEGNVEFKCYVVYKRTRSLNIEEMSRLIDGTVSEAKELGIETATPEELNRMKSLWGTAPKG